ncbi:MAG: S8 family serine peptidase [Dehalococcoidia bacterium]|nr:S8 family serine peptidase [Dehalococcoidia bacterium]
MGSRLPLRILLGTTLVSIAACLGGVFVAGPAGADRSGAPSAFGPTPSPPQRTEAVLSLPAQPALRKAHPKLDTALTELSDAYARGGIGEARAAAATLALDLPQDRARVIIETVEGRESALRGPVRGLGATIEKESGSLAQALVPVQALRGLAALDSVALVRRPLVALPAAVGEGVALVNADDWHAAGVTGSGMKVAIVDLGFQGYSSLLGTELPSSVVTHSCRTDGDITGGGEKHGTGVAEIVHEMAPDAELYLVNFETEVDLATCIDWMAAQGVTVANHSVIWFGTGPGDGTGIINDIVNDAILTHGIFWANAAGNHALMHWMGNWSDPEENGFHNFTALDEGNTISVGAGESVLAVLKWDDPFGGSSNDYDIGLYSPELESFVCWSGNWQDGDDDPVDFFVCQPGAGTYELAIALYSADGTANFHLYTGSHPLEYYDVQSSILEPADNPNVLTTGAVFWGTPTVIEYFSSQGPTEDVRIKPDIVAPDGVTNATYPGGFFGTSAASPHSAGAAALVRQTYPSYTPAQVAAFLTGPRCIDLGAGGDDNVFGCGRLNLGSPPDTDTDGVIDAFDNCPLVANPPVPNGLDDDTDGTVDEAGEQVNTDNAAIPNGPVVALDDVTVPNGDPLGDACDDDDDNDGLTDAEEASAGTNPLLRDTDGDRVIDGAEVLLGSDPLNPGSKPGCTGIIDVDKDCLSANIEALLGTSDKIKDTDGDGINDGVEVMGWGTSPTSVDTDGDGCNDDKEIADVNGDRISGVLDYVRVAQRAFSAQDDDPDDGDPVPDMSMVVDPSFDVNKDRVMTALDVTLTGLNSSLVEPVEDCNCNF